MINLLMPLTDVALSTAKKQDIGLFNSTSLPWFHMSYEWGAVKIQDGQAPSLEIPI